MNSSSRAQTPLVIEVDKDNSKKDIDLLDIELPILTPRITRDYKRLEQLSDDYYQFQTIEYLTYDDSDDTKEISFQTIT